MRTGAAAALGVKSLARKDSENLLLVGAGHQAFYMLAATLIEMPQIKNVRVIDPINYENAVKFTDSIISRLKDEQNIDVKEKVKFSPVNNMADVLQDTDVVITITRSTSPIIKKEWVKPGTHFSCIGADMIGKEEIDPEIFRSARSFADDTTQCIGFGEMEIPYKMGIITKDSIAGELGEVLSGKKEGRLSANDITVFDATGLALLDLVTGKIAIDLAKEKGFGTIVEI
jgi:ornithine cyclodeaminase/alanine dehydrogenase